MGLAWPGLPRLAWHGVQEEVEDMEGWASSSPGQRRTMAHVLARHMALHHRLFIGLR